MYFLVNIGGYRIAILDYWRILAAPVLCLVITCRGTGRDLQDPCNVPWGSSSKTPVSMVLFCLDHVNFCLFEET